MSAAFDLYYPIANQVHNRSDPSSVEDDLTIIGSIRFATSDIEARWGAGEWTTIASGVRGAFSATLADCSGQATLSVRPVDYPALQIDRANVGIGDVFLIIGQSNASGRGSNNQTWSHATLQAMSFANDYTWKVSADPLDSKVGQIDSVSAESDLTPAHGTVWIAATTALMAATGCPVGWIPAPMGATAIANWAPGAAGTHQLRTTLYGQACARYFASMNNIYRMGGVRCALWWQGEGDQFNTAAATYNTALDTLANTLYTEIGAKLMPQYKLQIMAANPGYVDTAVAEAIGDNANVLQGADLSGIDPVDVVNGVHLMSDAEIAAGGAAWAAAIKTAFGW